MKKAIYTPPISPTSYLSRKGYVTISPLYQSKRSNTVHFTNKALIYPYQQIRGNSAILSPLAFDPFPSSRKYLRMNLDNPHGNDFRFIFSLFLYMSYLTTTFTVSSPTVTRTIPAGTAIVALSEVTTVSANGIPNKLRT